ncbi:glycosyltransferase family 4 protein [Psychroserpens luteus]|uniref:Glycosyltransferase family 4 protein n=1 Tax=Psychroserpens luteus TaxID=1434066 RepID=A0ABW5ZWC3_9FLAO|nr:glycosyltransferase family 4 protein [Psychroserpens luteus]
MKHKYKNILIVTSEFPPQPGGIGNHAYNLADQLHQNDFNVSVIADQRSVSGNEENDFDRTNPFKTYRIRLKKIRLFMYLKRLIVIFKLIKKADVVIASGKFPLWVVAIYSVILRKKNIAIAHGTEVNFSNPLLKFSINKSLGRFQYIVAVSNYTKSLIEYLDLKNVVVIPNGYNPEKWNISIDGDLKTEGNPKLITVGNVTERKGQLNVINHIPKLLERYPNIHYHCIGIPTEKERFMSIVKKHSIEDHVTFHGRLSDHDLKEYLTNSDLLVMLSSATRSGDVEGFGIAVLEANALGIPAIGSTNCGIEDAISNFKSGILVPFDSSDEFSNAIQTIMENYDDYSKNALSWAESHKWNYIIKDYIELIN